MRLGILILFTLAGCATAGPARPAAVPLEVGFAAVDITPPLGYPMFGYQFVSQARRAITLRDALHAKAMVLAQGDTRAAIVVADLGGMPMRLSAEARARISERTGIPATHVTISATHTHTGPGFDPGPDDINYPATLVERLVEVVERAWSGRRPADLGAGVAEQHPVVSFQRRNLFKDGQVRMVGPTIRDLPEYDPSHVVGPTGPIDPDVDILAVWDRDTTRPRGVLTVFALHPNTVGDTRVGERVWSADYPAVVNREIERALTVAGQAEVAAMFGTGTCGNINYVDPSSLQTRSTEEIGRLIATTALGALPKITARSPGRLAVRTVRFDAPFRKFTAAEVVKARADLEHYQDLSFLRRAEAITMVDVAAMSLPTLPVEIQVFRLNRSIAVVTLPGEIFVQHGLAIKKASPFSNTLILELANDLGPGYVPTRKAFTEGGYEVLTARLEPGSGERMVEEAVRLLGELAVLPD